MTLITIQEVVVTKTSKGKNSWFNADVTYTDVKQDKEFTKKLISFKNPKVFGVIQKASPGQQYNIEVRKDGDYWEWVAIEDASTADEAPAERAKPAVAATTRSGNWETPEERAARQVYIIRQSSLATAVTLLGPKAKVSDVINVAQQFVDYVLGTEETVETQAVDTEVGE